MKKILNSCGYYSINVRPKDKRYIEALDILNYLQNEKMIDVITDLNTIKYDSVIELKIINENFDCLDSFTKIDSNEFNSIVSSNSNVSIENLIQVYLYVKSYIFKRNIKKPKNDSKPESFYRGITDICDDTGLAKETVSKCLEELIKLKLLVKHEIESYIKKKNGKKECFPNIYVLNNENSKQEIELTINILNEFYDVL
ncbi:hypothetical protein KQI61_07700 [Anaerocolumna aminovalerica]|uniref:hypothetical protein n=1 Tax=Anaerocolumna aminovalerica TaxID=1527 RepID=UPI001C0EA4D0|nr:hypothetical protein [Anaerocolumna aminovalerica]MBU5332080.1 hypothetical protein [Anaerocolumna aminovalerica]